MSAENDGILVESQNFEEPPSKKIKTYGRETETAKEKREKFWWTEEIVENLLYSPQRYRVIHHFSGKDFDAYKTVQYSKLRKEMAKKYESFGPTETPANPRVDLSIQQRKEFEGKIKLENKLIDTGYNRVLQRVI